MCSKPYRKCTRHSAVTAPKSRYACLSHNPVGACKKSAEQVLLLYFWPDLALFGGKLSGFTTL